MLWKSAEIEQIAGYLYLLVVSRHKIEEKVET